MEIKITAGKILNQPEMKDYTTAILFFVAFAFFTLVVIRPALIIAFSLQREAGDLKRIDAVYEKNISKLIFIQSTLENIRGKVYLLDQAMPKSPKTTLLIDDIRKVASEQNINLSNLNLSNVDLKNIQNKTKLNTLTVNLETETNFVAAKKFIDNLMSQRRIKTIKSLTISRIENLSSGSANLKISFILEGYYL